MTESASGYGIADTVQIIDSNGDSWGFGPLSSVPPNYQTFKNGALFGSGYGVRYLYANHTLFVVNSSNVWSKIGPLGTGWVTVSVATSGTTITTSPGIMLLASAGPMITLDAAPGHVCFNGVADATTSNASTVLWFNGGLYYENSSSAWFASTNNTAGHWMAIAGDPRPSGTPPTESADGTSITPGSGSIIDANGVVWSITVGGQVAKNGTTDLSTASVLEGYYTGHVFYQKASNANSLGLNPGWWSWNNANSTWVDSQDPTAGAGTGGNGPTSSGTVTVDFGTPLVVGSAAQTVSKYVWGVSTSTLGDNNFAAMTDTNLQPVLLGLNYPLYRFNHPDLMNAAYPSGATSATSATLHSIYGNLIDNWNKIIPAGARIIIGIGDNAGANWSSAANFAAACANLVTYFKNTNSASTGAPMPVYGWEIGNEDNNAYGGIPSWYNSYFSAASSAIKGVNSAWKVCGPVFSWAQDVNTFGGTGTACDVLDYHAYKYGGQSEFTSQGGLSAFLTDTMLSGIGSDFSSYTGGGGNSSAELFIGEYNGNNTYGTNSGGQSPGICNTYQQSSHMTVFAANTIKSGLDSTNKFTMAGIWSAWADSDYGVVGGSDNVNGSGAYTVSPVGYFLSKAAAVMYGPRYSVSKAVGAPSTLNAMAVAGGPGASNLGVLLINGSVDTAVNNCTVALSKWPGNVNGNGTVNVYEISPANPAGKLTSLTVTNGVSAAITVPAASTVFVYV